MLIDNYEIHNLQAQPQQYAVGQGPFIPPLTDCPAFLQPLLLTIAGMVVTTVTMGATGPQTHAGRVFLYNQLYRQNFQNTEFMMACSGVIDNILLGIHNREFNPADINQQVLDVCVSRSLGLLGAFNISRYPALRQHVPEIVVQEGMNLAAHAQQTMQIVNSLKVQYQQQSPQPMMMTGYQAPQQGYPGYVNPGAGQVVMHPGMAGGNMGGGMGGGSVFRNNPQAAFSMPGNHSPAAMNTPIASSDRYSHMSAPAAAIATTYQPSVQTPAQAAVKVVSVEPTLADWKCSTVQAYPHAYFADTEMLIARTGMDPINQVAIVVAQIQPKSTGEKDMDRARHQLTTGYTPQNPDALSGESLAAKSGDVLAAQGKQVLLRSDFYEEPLQVDTFGVVLGTDEAILKAQHRLMITHKGKVKDKAISCSYLKATPIVTVGTYREALASLFKCNTLEMMSSQLKRMRGSGPETELAQVVSRIDRYLTLEFNRFLRDKLALKTKLGSFMEDVPDIIKYLNDEYGSIYGDAMVENQRDFLMKAITPLDQTVYDQLIYTLIDPNHSAEPVEGDDSPLPYSAAIFQLMSVTAVGFTGAELNVGLLEQHSGVLTMDHFPGLLTFAKSIFKNAAESDQLVAHHYIVTTDSQVYEVHQGLIGIGTFLISRVK